ncbi:MraY family glycosyltransferase [Flavobacteriaceae bacterium MHTCC 0001]
MNTTTLENLTLQDITNFRLFATFCVAAAVSYFAYPKILTISKAKRLMQKPGDRSSHTVDTPNLGGIGIFLGITVACTLIGSTLGLTNLLCLIGAVVVLFFTGLSDDILELSPAKKLLGQLFAALFVIIVTDTRITSFFGLFGIHTIPYITSVAFTLFAFIVLINAFNLIDGIDGLASCVGILSSLLFSIYAYAINDIMLLLVSFSMIGALSTFLIFNFSTSRKMFMGDTGSMIIGFLLAYQAINFLGYYNQPNNIVFHVNPLIITIAIFSYPLTDTLRVFIIRILTGKSPFTADKNHIHHNLVALGFKHWEVAIIASFYILIVFGLTFFLKSLNIHVSLLILVLLSTVASTVPSMVFRVASYLDTTKTNIIKKRALESENSRYERFLKATISQVLNIFL